MVLLRRKGWPRTAEKSTFRRTTYVVDKYIRSLYLDHFCFAIWRKFYCMYWAHLFAASQWNVFRTARFRSPPPPPRGEWKQKSCFHSPPLPLGWLKTVFLSSVAHPIDFSCPPLSYRYCDTLCKMWQMNNRDCNKKSPVTDSTCKKRSTVNGKSQL